MSMCKGPYKSIIYNLVLASATVSRITLMNAMCTIMYLFIVNFSFAPVISANIHRYVNFFDIQVLMMVTETETLTSTLHHNIFTFLDQVFSGTFILSDFNPYLLSYIYIIIIIMKILSSFLISLLVAGWKWWINFLKLSREILDFSLAIIRSCFHA